MRDVRNWDEARFKQAMIKIWTERGAWITPIQTRTVLGVPDVYIANGYQDSKWVEFKRIKTKFINSAYLKDINTSFTVPFRAGQQAWAAKHWEITNQAVRCFIMFNDLVVWFPIMSIRENRIYTRVEVNVADTETQKAIYGVDCRVDPSLE